MRLTEGFGADVVVVAVSAAAAQNDGLEIAAKAGRVNFFAGLPKSNPIAPLDVNHIHYKDFSGNGPEPWAQMGTGKLDFHKITEWLTARNYHGWIVCEDECHDAIGNPDGVTRQNGEWCKANLAPLV